MLIGGVVLIGGQSGNKILDTIYKLTSISGTWTEIDSRLKIPRRHFAAWTISSHLLSDCSLGGIIFYYFLAFLSFYIVLKNYTNPPPLLQSINYNSNFCFKSSCDASYLIFVLIVDSHFLLAYPILL